MKLSTGWRPDALLECDLCVYDKNKDKKAISPKSTKLVSKAGHVFSFSTKDFVICH